MNIDMWDWFFGSWTDFFESILGPGGGNVFFLVPILVLAAGLWFKVPDKPMVPLTFIIASCAILATGNLFVKAYGVSILFIIVCALGMTGLIMNVVYHRGN